MALAVKYTRLVGKCCPVPRHNGVCTQNEPD